MLLGMLLGVLLDAQNDACSDRSTAFLNWHIYTGQEYDAVYVEMPATVAK
jgi:hypothetical protein